MAAKRIKRKAGRPKADDPLKHRVLCRLDDETKTALDKYVDRTKTAGNKAAGASTALRKILTDRLRAEGLLP